VSLRPVPARWFEAVVPQEMAARAIEALAATGRVQVEARAGRRRSLELSVLRDEIEKFRAIERRYSAHWPKPAYHHPLRNLPPGHLLALAIEALVRWQAEAEHLINRLAVLHDQREEVEFCRKALQQFAAAGLDLRLLQTRGGFLDVVCCCVPEKEEIPIFEDVLAMPFSVGHSACRLALVRAPQADALVRQMAARNVICTRFPDWLRFEDDYLSTLDERLEKLDEQIRSLAGELDTLAERHELADRLAEVRRVLWLAENVEAVEASDHFAWITGWTVAADEGVLNQALESRQVTALVHFTAAPEGSCPPLLLRHRKWIRPFELFSRALGMPGESDADPTAILAVLVPLMFGYMFGDVGHGLLLLLAGLYLQRRWETARILVLCGIAAMAFGFLFGGVFSREDVIPALWIHPLQEPLLILTVPLVGAIALLSGGIFLNGLQTRWRQQVGSAWLGDVGFFLFYVAVVAAFADGRFLWLAPVGLGTYLWANAEKERILASLLESLGHFVEISLQILINTLSFLRVGAFALAHEGLSNTTSLLADATGNTLGFLLVMVLGNLLVTALEGLVVSIQTTRLVLFEFFVRFIRGAGRAFQPLPFPPSVLEGEESDGKT